MCDRDFMFRYPDGQAVLVGDALLWGDGGFYPGRVTAIATEMGPAGPVRVLVIDEGRPMPRRLRADQIQSDDLRLVERATRDHRLACLQWLGQRIADGNPHSAYVMGCLLREGHTIPRDPRRAVPLFEHAVAKGHPLAMVELALLAAAGDGFDAPQPARAHALMQRAADAGIPAARRWLDGQAATNPRAPG